MTFRTQLEFYNADDEEPCCIRCDHCGGGFACENMCGPNRGWYGYKRTCYVKRVEE